MKGYLYLDNEHNLNVRNQEYIDQEDPGFWGRNSHTIDIVWKFDTESEESMYKLLSSLVRYELPNRKVIDMCKSIGFDLEAFRRKQTPASMI